MHRHRRRIRTPERQPDLFPTSQPPAAEVRPGPGWSSLPDVTQQAVTALMTRLLITHAGAGAMPAMPEGEGDADERR